MSAPLRTFVLVVGVSGLLFVAALLWAISTAVGRVFPVTGSGASTVAGVCWPVVMVIVMANLLAARPSQTRMLLEPPDRSLLMAWRVPPRAVSLARLWLPQLVGSTGVFLSAVLVAVPWLSASEDGARVLPAVLVTAAGTALTAALSRVCATAALATSRGMHSVGRRVAWTTAAAFTFGYLVSPLVAGILPSATLKPEAMSASFRRTASDFRPKWWDELFLPGHLSWTWAVWSVSVVVLVVLACGLVRRAERHSALHPCGPTAPRATVGRTASRPLHATGLITAVVIKDLLSAQRRPTAVTGPLYRVCVLGLGLAALGCGVRLRYGTHLPWSLPADTWGTTAAVAMYLAISGIVAQVAGVEAEHRSIEMLRQAPVPFGRVLVGKVAACTVIAALPVVPGYLGLLLAGGGPMVPSTFLALPVALLAGSCAIVATAFLVPLPERFDDERTSRSGVAETVEGVLAALLASPTALGPVLRGATGAQGGTALAIDTGAGLAALLVMGVGLGALARRDLHFRKATP
ncbi:hypothetical protein [Streptomyces natalensis]|uniref:Uncharacterized protein n=1 Tax=Streptomyces natalensis ATCC 27448 TaxID=1240678 RepID=A0A0D7CST1_9ACTN|nr:hypothetical protein [Streptomyces natalensis]KIZ18462.1 hypothetical protein SNA_07570 [Streptomyces natalensis ATCC 27448]